MPTVHTITPPTPEKNTSQYYDDAGQLITSDAPTLQNANGIRILLTAQNDVGNRFTQYTQAEFEYSTDGGTTWQTLGTGSLTPAEAYNNDSGELSDAEMNNSGTFTYEQYIPPFVLDAAVDIRIRMTDLLGRTTVFDAISYTITDLNYGAFESKAKATFDMPIDTDISFAGLETAFRMKFDNEIKT